MQAASLFDGFSFDLFPPFENGLTAPEVDVSRRQVCLGSRGIDQARMSETSCLTHATTAARREELAGRENGHFQLPLLKGIFEYI
jgi:hypothetical protein